MWLTNSSVGRKVVMSVTGLFLILFLTFHALMNAVALIKFEYYEAVCEFLGANWYALVGTAVLAGGFCGLHRLLQLGQAADDDPLPLYGADYRNCPGKPEEQ